MVPEQPYTLQFLKYPDTLHWRHEATWLGEDDHGVWLGCTPGSIAQRGLEPAKRIRQGQVHLVPRSDWWVVTYAPGHPWAAWWIDISTPATFEKDRVTMIDLDLDVVGRTDGTIFVDDEDEFAEHQETLGYPRDLIDNAIRATTEMVEALTDRSEPFESVADTWLERVPDLPV